MKRTIVGLLSAILILNVIIGCKKKETEPSITGIMVILQAQPGTNVDVNNTRVQIYFDAEFVNLVKEGAATGTSVEASITLEVNPGTYYVLAWKDMNNNGVIDGGDIYGFYANDVGQPNPVNVQEGKTVEITFTVGLYVVSTTIRGTATLAEGLQGDLGGAIASLYASIDDWNADNYLERINVEGSGNSVTFVFSDLDAGVYYLDVWKDNDNSGNWTAGDFVGVYDTNGDFVPDPINLSEGSTVDVEVTVGILQGTHKNKLGLKTQYF